MLRGRGGHEEIQRRQLNKFIEKSMKTVKNYCDRKNEEKKLNQQKNINTYVEH